MSWEQVLSNEVLDIRDGTHDSPKYKDEGYPLITSKNLKNGVIDFSDVSLISEEDFTSINKRSKVDQGDILYSMIGSVGNYAFVDRQPDFAIKNVALFKFSDSRLYNKYFLHLLNSFVINRQVERAMKGGTQKFVSLKILRNLQIPLPPLPQQKKIAAILDAADAYRQKTKALIAKYDELTQSLFLDMFGDPVTNPKGFQQEELGSHIELVNGRAYKRPELLSEGTPVLRIQNLNGGDRWYYSDMVLPEKKYCFEGDLLFAWSASFGPYIYSGEKAIFHYHIWNCQLQKSISKSFAYYLLLRLTETMKSASHGASMLHLTKSQMEEWKIIIPPLELQNQFAERVQAIEAQKAQAQESLAKAEDLFNSLLQRAFKGELTN